MKKGSRVMLRCYQCRTELSVALWRVKRGGGKYCSQNCKNLFQVGKPSKRLGLKQPSTTGENNPRWNGGRTKDAHGYILVKAPTDHPYKMRSGYIRQHRLIMETYECRYLLPTEDVHHLDGDKTNNEIDNLELFDSRSDHLTKYHRHAGKATWFKKGIKRSTQHATTELY